MTRSRLTSSAVGLLAATLTVLALTAGTPDNDDTARGAAQAGLVIGLAVLLAIIALVVMVLLRRRKAREVHGDDRPGPRRS